jgi:hypothetical protein
MTPTWVHIANPVDGVRAVSAIALPMSAVRPMAAGNCGALRSAINLLLDFDDLDH